ncbi:DUF2528 family protein [Lysobacter yananisis]|uniref:DUF2528 family protein n=1 Tax=Lysobacter yananisis TaxID=1003114 RepID=A0ABY9PAF9_9GAMM|nr:DUF2528 family protein [Lysobacter yananisis]WMT03339.1 DUF2528 family protein [Lysobacter yananisis]
MAIKRYNIWHGDTGADVTIDVDTDVLTDELATEINNFRVDADERLERAHGDVVEAVVTMAAAEFLAHVLDVIRWPSIEQIQREFDGMEGWPPNGAHGIRLVRCEGRPDLDSSQLDVTEVELE